MDNIDLKRIHIGDVLIIIILLGSVGFYGFNRLDNRMEKLELTLNENIKQQAHRWDEMNHQYNERMNEMNKRSDRLYEMFYEVVREKKFE